MLPSYVHFGTFSPHRCYASSEQNHNQPATNPNWAKLDTFQACEICLFRCSCSIGMQHPKHAPDHPWKLNFSFYFFLQKSKGRHLAPTVSLRRMRRVPCDTFEREKNNGFYNRAKFHIRLWNRMIFLQTIYIIRKCYPSIFLCTFPP
jgi:hypothetical protein